MPAYPENVRSPGVDRKSPWSCQTDANDRSRLRQLLFDATLRPWLAELNAVRSIRHDAHRQHGRSLPSPQMAPEILGTALNGEYAMTLLIKTLATIAAGTVLATSAFAQSAREIRGASPFETIANEPAAKLIVDQPLPGPLAQGQFLAQYRVENVRLLQVFGPGALSVTPRVGHRVTTIQST
jgi:hypothetical protein